MPSAPKTMNRAIKADAPKRRGDGSSHAFPTVKYGPKTNETVRLPRDPTGQNRTGHGNPYK